MLVFAHILSQKVRSTPFFETRVEYVTVICVTALLFCYQGDKVKLSFRCFTRLGSKSLLHSVVHTKSVKELAEISCISLQSLTSSFRKIQIFKFAYLHFPCFIPCLGSKSLLYRVVHTKSVRESAEITYIGRDNLYSHRRARFNKIQIIEFAYLHFHCLRARCLGLKIINASSCIYEKC